MKKGHSDVEIGRETPSEAGLTQREAERRSDTRRKAEIVRAKRSESGELWS